MDGSLTFYLYQFCFILLVRVYYTYSIFHRLIPSIVDIQGCTNTISFWFLLAGTHVRQTAV
ncbi:hypothetical protein BDZ91DRAFT_715548 [Kalaharituber pfeilii]|nr:hypothetical protein BDZ91DRAFT_715548 [Kalaharituber pfeilii]